MNLSELKVRLPNKIVDASNSLEMELNSLLAEEFQAWYQYYIVTPFLVGKERPSVQKFFQETADDELNDHATKLINRLDELGYNCFLRSPESWKEYAESKFVVTDAVDVQTQLQINKTAEEEAIAHYQKVTQLAESLGDNVTSDILKKIQADEEQHLSEIINFLEDIQ